MEEMRYVNRYKNGRFSGVDQGDDETLNLTFDKKKLWDGISEKVSSSGIRPLDILICNNSVEFVQYLMDYANKHGLPLNINEKCEDEIYSSLKYNNNKKKQKKKK